jgi:hypothetical protein
MGQFVLCEGYVVLYLMDTRSSGIVETVKLSAYLNGFGATLKRSARVNSEKSAQPAGNRDTNLYVQAL